MPSDVGEDGSVKAQALALGGPRAVKLVDDLLRTGMDRRQFFGLAAKLGLSTSAAVALLTACTGSSSPAAGSASQGTASAGTLLKTLSWRPSADVQNVDPAILPGLEDPTYAACFFEGLIARKPGGSGLVNCLAEEFEQSKDGLQLHFTLKQGILFQKGYGEVQASDVKFSFERIAGLTKPNLNSPYQGDWAALQEVRVDSKYSGTIILKEVFAPTLTEVLPGNSGMVVSEKAVEKLGKSFGTSPVGTGPYEWVSWVPGQKLVMTKFADYSGANKAYANKNLFEEIQALPISSDDTAYAALQTGEVNLCELGTSTVKEAQSNSALKVYQTPSGDYYWLAMNVTEPPLDNIWLRKAIRSAIDVPGIIKDAYNGLYTRANAIIPPSMPIGYWPQAPAYNQDLTLAKSYLAKSGLKDITLKLNVDNVQDDVAASQIIAANLAEIGIKVNVEPIDPATISDLPGPGGGGAHPQLLYYYYGGAGDPNEWFEWWTCSQVGLWNWDHWCNSEFTNLTTEALHTYDTDERTKLYIEAQKLWDAEAGMVWVAYADSFIAVQPDIVPSFDKAGDFFVWNTTTT